MFLILVFLIPVLIAIIAYLVKTGKKPSETTNEIDVNDHSVEVDEPLQNITEEETSLVVVYSTSQLMEAHFLSAKLDSLGIDNELQDVNTVSINPLLTNAIGGVKIIVRREDEQNAIDIIKEIQEAPLLNEDGSILTCPKCNSDEFYTDYKSYKGTGGMLTGIFAAYIFNAAIGSTSLYKCKVCGFEFERELT